MTLLNIIGGGFAGLVYAIHVMEQKKPPKTIHIYEPSDELGYGVAYAPDHGAFRLNIPCSVIKIGSEQLQEFTEWVDDMNPAKTDMKAVLPDGRRFYKRRLFGDYISDVFQKTVQAFDGEVRHTKTRLRALPSHGTTVLATGVGKPSSLTAPTHYNALLIQNPYDLQSLSSIKSDKSVLIVGSGLTALDIANYLSMSGHTGKIEMISRSGRLPLVDSVKISKEPETLTSVSTASTWLKTRRQFCEFHTDAFAAFTDVRQDLRENWCSYSDDMKTKLIRHGLGFWNIHRFRASPQTMEKWIELENKGQAKFTKRAYGPSEETADVVINCTGPTPVNQFDLPLDQIGERVGVNIGFDLNQDASVKSHSSLYAIGADCRSLYADAYGAPDIAEQAKKLAQNLYG